MRQSNLLNQNSQSISGLTPILETANERTATQELSSCECFYFSLFHFIVVNFLWLCRWTKKWSVHWLLCCTVLWFWSFCKYDYSIWWWDNIQVCICIPEILGTWTCGTVPSVIFNDFLAPCYGTIKQWSAKINNMTKNICSCHLSLTPS